MENPGFFTAMNLRLKYVYNTNFHPLFLSKEASFHTVPSSLVIESAPLSEIYSFVATKIENKKLPF